MQQSKIDAIQLAHDMFMEGAISFVEYVVKLETLVVQEDRLEYASSIGQTAMVMDHVTDENGALVDAGMIEVEIDPPLAQVNPPVVYLIVHPDRGDGFHRVSTSGCYAFSARAVAREEINRFMLQGFHDILELPVLDNPTCLGTPEQQVAWNLKKGK